MHPQTLRKYERLGLVRPTRTVGSMRMYSTEEIDRLRAIKRLVDELVSRGFEVVPSQANFVWATHPDGSHQRRFEALKAQRVLVRHMVFAACDPQREGLRITVGTDEEIDRLLEALDGVGS